MSLHGWIHERLSLPAFLKFWCPSCEVFLEVIVYAEDLPCTLSAFFCRTSRRYCARLRKPNKAIATTTAANTISGRNIVVRPLDVDTDDDKHKPAEGEYRRPSP